MSVTFYTTNHFWHHYPENRRGAESRKAGRAKAKRREGTARHGGGHKSENANVPRFDRLHPTTTAPL